jgi:hypothetical protein
MVPFDPLFERESVSCPGRSHGASTSLTGKIMKLTSLVCASLCALPATYFCSVDRQLSPRSDEEASSPSASAPLRRRNISELPAYLFVGTIGKVDVMDPPPALASGFLLNMVAGGLPGNVVDPGNPSGCDLPAGAAFTDQIEADGAHWTSNLAKRYGLYEVVDAPGGEGLGLVFVYASTSGIPGNQGPGGDPLWKKVDSAMYPELVWHMRVGNSSNAGPSPVGLESLVEAAVERQLKAHTTDDRFPAPRRDSSPGGK